MNNFIWWIRYGIWTWLSDRPRKIKSFLQRGWRGWADEDTWDFDAYLTIVITQGLKHLKKYYHGTDPSEEVFNKIIEGFECAQLLMDELKLDHDERIFAEQIKNEGFDLFKKYFNYFWD